MLETIVNGYSVNESSRALLASVNGWKDVVAEEGVPKPGSFGDEMGARLRLSLSSDFITLTSG
jgi:hypothetical protein